MIRYVIQHIIPHYALSSQVVKCPTAHTSEADRGTGSNPSSAPDELCHPRLRCLTSLSLSFLVCAELMITEPASLGCYSEARVMPKQGGSGACGTGKGVCSCAPHHTRVTPGESFFTLCTCKMKY